MSYYTIHDYKSQIIRYILSCTEPVHLVVCNDMLCLFNIKWSVSTPLPELHAHNVQLKECLNSKKEEIRRKFPEAFSSLKPISPN